MIMTMSSPRRHLHVSIVMWYFLGVNCLIALTMALPSSLMDEIKTNEMKNFKDKESHNNEVPNDGGAVEKVDAVNRLNKRMTAIKRSGFKVSEVNPSSSASISSTWINNPNSDNDNNDDGDVYDGGISDKLFRNNDFNMQNVKSGLFNDGNFPIDDKTIAEYDKAYRYGTNKDQLDEMFENSVLKGELYRDPYGQIRYYGNDDKRKRRDTTSILSNLRLKRNTNGLSVDELMALLSLYENNRQALKEGDNYLQPKYRNREFGDNDFDSSDETWLPGPVYPHASVDDFKGDNYLFDYTNNEPQINYKPNWGGFDETKKKRLMMVKKRANDPTKLIRYINGPNRHNLDNFYNAINEQKEPKGEVLSNPRYGY